VPVNPHERSVAGLTAFASVADIKKPIDIKNFVVPPDVSTEVVRALDPDQVRHVWFQPASYDAHMLATAATARAAVARRLADLRRQWIG
jgi:predicted CoA-binding protein